VGGSSVKGNDHNYPVRVAVEVTKMSAGDDTIFETMLRVENKDIFVDLKKNRSGVYLKISERNGTSRNTVLIPASGIPRLKKVLEDVALASIKTKGVR
jgi:hypothetical protein